MMSDTSERPPQSDSAASDSSAADSSAADAAATVEPSHVQPPPREGMLRGTGAALGAGDLVDRLRRRVSRDVLPSVRALADHAREAAETARPHVERAAEQARAAAEAALPRVEEAGRAALRYTREHEDDLKRASTRAAQTIAKGAIPRPLRSAADAFEAGLREAPPASPTPHTDEDAAPSESHPSEPPPAR